VVAGQGTGALLSSALISLGLPLSGSQTWRFGPVAADSTRPIAILPGESSFDCAGTSFSGLSVKICARLDPTQYCQGGPNDGKACPPADCGGNPCEAQPGGGAIDCAAAGGSFTGYDSLVQIDHNTNAATVGGRPNLGLPADPTCVGTFVAPDGSVLHSCLEPVLTPTPVVGPGTPTLTPAPTLAPGAEFCGGTDHGHPYVCNSPTEQTFSGPSVAGGFRLREAIDLSFALSKSCTDMNCVCDTSSANTNGNTCTADAECGNAVCAVCPPAICPLQAGELQIAGEITSGLAKGVLWNANNTTAIMGTTGPGNGASVCGGKPCSTEINGVAIDLSSTGGSCTGDPTNVPASVSGATLGLAYPALDFPTVGDIVATLTLQCGQ